MRIVRSRDPDTNPGAFTAIVVFHGRVLDRVFADLIDGLWRAFVVLPPPFGEHLDDRVGPVEQGFARRLCADAMDEDHAGRPDCLGIGAL